MAARESSNGTILFEGRVAVSLVVRLESDRFAVNQVNGYSQNGIFMENKSVLVDKSFTYERLSHRALNADL